MGADADIVEHGKVWKQRDVLERPPDADLGDPVRRPRQNAAAFHQDVAGGRLIQPAQAVEQRGLAGAIRADQSEDLSLVHVERHAGERDDAAEHDVDVTHREQRIAAASKLRLRHVVSPTITISETEGCCAGLA